EQGLVGGQAAVHLPVACDEFFLAVHGHHVKTILPMCRFDSISAWASAASAAANVLWMTGRTRPAASRGHTCSRNARAMAPLNATGRGRSVEPVMVSRRRSTSPALK